MPSRSVTVRISAEDQFSQTIDRYNQKMGQADRATESVSDSARNTRASLGGLGAAFAGAIAAISAQEIVQAVGQLNELGSTANATEARFNALVAPIGNVTAVMADLRAASLGVASDMQLQTGANMLLSMGIAESPEELEEIIGLITRLKNPTDSLGDAINNFGLMMANQSVLRLDSFGLSSGRVRDRINELLESGKALNREQAFKMATLEEGARAIERLGDSADVAGTAMARTQTKWQNLMEDIGQGVNVTLDSAITSAEQLAGILSILAGQGPSVEIDIELQTALQTTLNEDVGAVIGTLINDDMFNQLPDDLLIEYMRRLVEKVNADPSLMADIGALRSMLLGDMTAAGFNLQGPVQMGFSDTGEFNAMLEMATEYALQIQAANASQREITAEMEQQVGFAEQARIERERLAELDEAQFDYMDEMDRLRTQGNREGRQQAEERAARLREIINYQSELDRLNQRGLEAAREQAELEERRIATRAQLLGGMDFLGAEIGNIAGANLFDPSVLGAGEMPRFMTADQSDQIREMADEAKRIADEMERAAKQDETLFTEGELEVARAQADEMGRMADEADRAAQAFENMSLTDIFGQTSGGIAGEISDMVIEAAQADGMSAEDQELLQQVLDLQSGRQTTGSVAMEETIAPLIAQIASETGPEMAAAAVGALEDIMQEGALQGVDMNDQSNLDQIVALLSGSNAEDLAMFDPAAFVTALADSGIEEGGANLMGAFAEDMQSATDNMEHIQEIMPEIDEEFMRAAGQAKQMAGSMSTAVTELDTLNTRLGEMTQGVKTIRVRLDVDMGALNSLMAQATQSNGGVPPGSDPRLTAGTAG